MLPLTRRHFLSRASFTVAAGVLAPVWWPGRSISQAAVSRTQSKHFEVEKVERTTVRLPFREVPERAMDRELPHWRYSEIFRVQLRSGAVGVGETLLFYTWGASNDSDVQRVMGRNAVDLMWDDSLGAGLQMALFDAVGRTAEVPIHRLLGRKLADRTPLSWWNIDMPPEDMARECQEAYRLGYRSYKTKGRPWFDLWAQVEQSCRVAPEDFKIDMDFNDTLLDAERAIPILKELEKFPQIDIYETPIPQRDVAGNRAIREATRVQIALHYGTPPLDVVVRESVCDGFVIGGGASRVMQQGQAAAEVKLPFWLQLVGTGLTAAYSLHFGAVLSHARWPAVNCHQLYVHPLLTRPIEVRDGFAQIPDSPGLGYDVDWDTVSKYQTHKPAERPEPERLIETAWPDGRKMYFANTGRVNFMLTEAAAGRMPFFTRGVTSRPLPNDRSPGWKELYTRARSAPFLVP